jgi:hypothetical protein
MNYILQKGYIRTCTNYTRVLLEKNFNARVITVAKHNDREGLYVDMNRYINLVKEQKGWPYKLSKDEIQDLYNQKKFNYVVCVKNPYSWFYSVSKTGPSMHRPDPSNPWTIIKKFNDRYRGWIDIIEKNKDNSFIVRHEDLLDNFNDTMKNIEIKFKLKSLFNEYQNESRDVLGQSKGQKRIGDTLYNQALNNKRMPLAKNGKPIYGVEDFNRIRDEIDWDVMSFYGYGDYNDDYYKLYGDVK